MFNRINKYIDSLIAKKLAERTCDCQEPKIENNEKTRPKRTFVKQRKVNKQVALDHNEYLKRTSIIWGVLAEYISDLRIKAKMNQRKFAKKLNISPSQVSRLEAGKIAVTNEMAQIIDELFNVNIKRIWDFPCFEEKENIKDDEVEQYRIPFGKFTGKTANEIPRHYAAWLKQTGVFRNGKNQELYKALIKAGKL